MKDGETKIVRLMSVTGRPEGYVMCVRGEEQARQTGKGEGREEGKAGGREKKRQEERKQEKGKREEEEGDGRCSQGFGQGRGYRYRPSTCGRIVRSYFDSPAALPPR